MHYISSAAVLNCKPLCLIYKLNDMKKITLLMIITLLSAITYGQNYSKIGKIGKYQDDWALVEDENGFLGFINNEGDVIISPRYKAISKFGKYREEWALVEDENGFLGFINSEGQEILRPGNYVKIYWQDRNKMILIGVLEDGTKEIIKEKKLDL